MFVRIRWCCLLALLPASLAPAADSPNAAGPRSAKASDAKLALNTEPFGMRWRFVRSDRGGARDRRGGKNLGICSRGFG